MPFKVSDTFLERVMRGGIVTEVIKGPKTLNVDKQITHLYKGLTEYTVILPKGKAGQQKSIILYNSDNSGSVNVQYTAGFQNNSYTEILALSTIGDAVHLEANAFGWYIVKSHILE
jgi:hypothetical protein